MACSSRSINTRRLGSPVNSSCSAYGAASASARLRRLMSVSEPANAIARPQRSRRTSPRLSTQRYLPSRWRIRCSNWWTIAAAVDVRARCRHAGPGGRRSGRARATRRRLFRAPRRRTRTAASSAPSRRSCRRRRSHSHSPSCAARRSSSWPARQVAYRFGRAGLFERVADGPLEGRGVMSAGPSRSTAPAARARSRLMLRSGHTAISGRSPVGSPRLTCGARVLASTRYRSMSSSSDQ